MTPLTRSDASRGVMRYVGTDAVEDLTLDQIASMAFDAHPVGSTIVILEGGPHNGRETVALVGYDLEWEDGSIYRWV